MPTQTEAIVVHESGQPWSLEEIELPDLAEDEVLVEMVAAGKSQIIGMCYSDIKAGEGRFKAKPPMVLGHEGVGYVREAGKKVLELAAGDMVILSFACCTKCSYCMAGMSPYCQDIIKLNFGGQSCSRSLSPADKQGNSLMGSFFGQSSFSRVAIVNPSCAVKVELNDREDLKKLVLGCGLQTGAGSILNVAKPPVNSSIAIWGCGGVGLAAIMAAKLTSPKHLIVIETVSSKLAFATKYGATHVINGLQENVQQRIMEITGGKGVDFALDCVGRQDILKLGQACLVAKGCLITVGGLGGQDVVLYGDSIITKGLTYRGCHQGDSVPQLFIPKLVDLWKRGLFPVDEIQTYYRFTDYEEALKDLRKGTAVKPVLIF
ncbi:MAG: hypothetical protein CYPHOPRED_000983 [Cyphobasidiales sp. Tagirdzhanova-0007]|nr:MAG: hypothetical protein CYPHOPRED_000983 [Cyphobasidiales sp. Tagirdzhanova-0007]